jgi:hypothetical protein
MSKSLKMPVVDEDLMIKALNATTPAEIIHSEVVFYMPLMVSGSYANCGGSRLRNYFVRSELFFPEDRFRTFPSCCPAFRQLTRNRSMTRPIPR